MKRLLITLLLLTARPAFAQERWVVGGVIAGNISDAVSSTLAYESHNGQESNILIGNNLPRLYAVKGCATVAEVMAVHTLWQTDHKRTAVFVTIGLGILNTWVTVHNLNIAAGR